MFIGVGHVHEEASQVVAIDAAPVLPFALDGLALGGNRAETLAQGVMHPNEFFTRHGRAVVKPS